MDKHDIENRLINFAGVIVDLAQSIQEIKALNHLAGQLIRSETSPALNYAEAISGESRKDFIHKIKIVLKELRESHFNLKIIIKTTLYKNEEKIIYALNECNELIAIFVSSVRTAELNVKKNSTFPK
jgi:four helix bundle protein